MRWYRSALAMLFGALVALSAPLVVAEMAGPMASVVHADRVSPRVAAEGKAQVVPLTRGENAYLGEFSLAAGAEIEPRLRSDEEYLYVLTGSALIKINDETFFVGPRMGIYVPAGSKVGWVNGPERLVAVQFFAGTQRGSEFDQLQIDEGESVWPQRRPRPRRIRGRISQL